MSSLKSEIRRLFTINQINIFCEQFKKKLNFGPFEASRNVLSFFLNLDVTAAQKFLNISTLKMATSTKEDF